MGEEELVLRAAIRDELSGPLEGIRDEVRGLGHDADTTGRQASRASKGFDILGKAGKIAAVGAAAAFGAALAGGYALLRLGKAAYGEAMEARKVGATTNAILKSTGATAWTSSKQIGSLATAISNKIGVDDEAIQSGENLLLTFKQVRNEVGKGNAIFDRATKAAADLSAAGFGDLAGSAKLMGKALNDPIKGMTALSRSGVTFTQDQQDRVKWLVEHNQLLGAQKIVLGEVESQVKGTAAAQATWADKAKVAWGNLEERLGNSLLPVLEDVSQWFVTKGMPVLDQWVGVFERRGIPAIKEFAETWLPRVRDGAQEAYDTLLPLAQTALPIAADVFDRIKDTVKVLAPLLVDVFQGFNGLPSWAKTAVIGAGGAAVVGQKLGVWQKLLGGAGSGAGGLVGMFTKAKPLPVIVVNEGWGGSGVGGGGGRGAAGGGARRGLGAAALTYGPQVAALATTGYMAYNTEKTILPGQKQSLVTTATGPSRTGGTALPSVVTANEAGEKLWRAGLSKDWDEVIRLVVEYQDELQGSATAQQQLAGVSNMYANAVGGSLEDAANKAMHLGDELDTVGKMYVTPTINLSTEAAELRLQSFQSKIDALGAGGLTTVGSSDSTGGGKRRNHREHGGPVKAGEPYIVGERRPELFVPRVDGYIKPRVPEPAAASGGRSSSAGMSVTVAEGAIVVQNPASTIDLEAALVDGIERWMRDREENA